MDAPPPLSMTAAPAIPMRRKTRWWIPVVIIAVVVLAIPAVLFAIGTPVYMRAMTNAKREAAITFARQVEQSVRFHQTDHSSLPVPSSSTPVPGDSHFTTDTPDGIDVINQLIGHNPRKVKYLAINEAKHKKGGATYDPGGIRVTAVFDFWGNPYVMILDTDYDGSVTVPLSTPITLTGKHCAVYSAGPDGILGTADDIKTWP